MVSDNEGRHAGFLMEDWLSSIGSGILISSLCPRAPAEKSVGDLVPSKLTG